ncbi:MAG: hypothetical protein RIC87_24705 [Kiloniellales bacterium]
MTLLKLLGGGLSSVADLASDFRSLLPGAQSTEAALQNGPAAQDEVIIGLDLDVSFGVQPALAVGLESLSVESADGDDTILGAGLALSLFAPAGFGIAGSEIMTGDGRDSVIGLGTTIGGLSGLGQGIAGGIAHSDIDTGSDKDLVKGATMVIPGDEGAASGNGIESSNIWTGSGADAVVAKALALIGETGDGSETNGFLDSYVNTGGGHDSVIAETSALVGRGGQANFFDAVDGTTILTAGGDDRVVAKAKLWGDSDTELVRADGFDSSSVSSGKGDDVVIGRVQLTGGPGSDLSDSDGFDDTNVVTGEGDDFVFGKSSLSGEDLLAAYGDGFFNLSDVNVVSTGDGNDRVVGIGAKVAIANPDGIRPVDQQTSEGFDNYTVRLGDGNDEVVARGASAGIKDAIIKGGDGNDILDLHSGTGMVDGGDDLDTLLLRGDSSEYDFQKTGSLEGTITEIAPGGVTDMTVAAVELFHFDNGVFDFDALFT